VSNLSTIWAEMASNHGRVTKRLYPPLENKLTTLKSKLESKLALETTNLATKGDSLLAKITSLDDTIQTDVGGRIAALETKIEAVTTTFDARITALEPPVRTPATTTNSASTASAGNGRAGPTTAPGRGAEVTPDDAPINVNACTRAAFDNARQLNPSLLTGDSHNYSHGCTPIRDPYNTSTTHGRHNPSTSQQPKRQTTLFESLGIGAQMPVNTRNTSGGRSGDDKHHHIDTAGNIHPVMGRGLISPPHRDQARHARTLGASRFDVICLASTKYHVGMEGLATLTEDDICASGYAEITATAEDTVICYNDIILAHRKVTELWHNGYANSYGPQVDKILQKSLLVFPKLEYTRVEDVVAFYNHLQEVALGYAIALMPFNAIVLTHKFEGLCPPGLGLVKYATMCKALIELLPWLIPGSLSPQINATLASVRYESNNGYDYLWRVMELTVTGFDPTIPIHAPFWSNIDDIFHFAQAFLLFFRLQAKVKFHYDNRTRSGMFLRAAQFSEFADTVTTLQSHVNSFVEEYDSGYLPPHLHLHGLANSIHQNAQACLRDIVSPRVRRVLDNDFSTDHRITDGNYSQVQGLPRANRFG
jgi:hypothetical protein